MKEEINFPKPQSKYIDLRKIRELVNQIQGKTQEEIIKIVIDYAINK